MSDSSTMFAFPPAVSASQAAARRLCTERHQANEFAVGRMEARLELRLAEFGAELAGDLQALRR